MENIHKHINMLAILAVMLMSALGISGSATAFTDSIWEDVVLDYRGSKDIEGNFAKDIQYGMAGGDIFNYGSTTITKRSVNKIGIQGTTMAHRTCDELYLYLYLERKVNGSYGTYKYWRYTDTNLYELSKSLSVIVPKGYYYRIRGYHSAVYGDTKETRTMLTDGIYIG